MLIFSKIRKKIRKVTKKLQKSYKIVTKVNFLVVLHKFFPIFGSRTAPNIALTRAETSPELFRNFPEGLELSLTFSDTLPDISYIVV